MLVTLVRSLSTNENAKDIIREDYFDTDIRQNNIALILLAFFIPWHQLADKYHLHRLLLETYLDYC